MSCWVVATLAAEVLGIPVSQVLERIRTGTLSSKTDLGFLLVDVAPDSPRIELKGTHSDAATNPRPATYRSIAAVRRAAEPELPLPRSARGGRLQFTPDAELTPEEELALGVDPEPSTTPSKFEKTDWRHSRAAASRTRLRPATHRAA